MTWCVCEITFRLRAHACMVATVWWRQFGRTPLLIACRRGHIDVARWLVAEAFSDVTSEQDEVKHRSSVLLSLSTSS